MNPTVLQLSSKFKESLRLYQQACELFPYGTQLFSRRPELGPFGQAPIYFSRAKHGHFWDVDGNEFVDTAMAVGPVSLGYCYDPVDNAVKAQIDKGILGSINSPLEIELANMMVELVPCAEMVKICKTGGEADAIAVRIARGYTGKDVVLFCGYHGWHDWYLAANLQSQAMLDQHLMPGINPKGVPAVLAGTTIPFEFNNLDSLQEALNRHQGQVACIIMEATRFKHPNRGFLEGVRQLADEHECVLIFDEVVTGFRIAPGGAQEYYQVTPDLATFAKAIANGYPLAAVAGKAKIMASQRDNFISSTYWSDTIGLAAGMATIKEIKEKPVIATIGSMGRKLMEGLAALGHKYNITVALAGHGYDFTISFAYGDMSNKILTLFQQEMIGRGIYTNGMIYVCFSHTQEDVDKILAAAEETFVVLNRGIAQQEIDSLLKCPPRQSGFRRLV